jgi:hypothetical protein
MKDNWSTSAVLLVFTLVFGGVGLGASWAIVSTLRDGYAARDWVRVKADVLSYSGDALSYRYRVGDKEFKGSRLSVGFMEPSEIDSDLHARLTAAEKDKKPITVFVDPADPARSVVDIGIPWQMLLFLTPFALAFGGVGVGTLYMAVKLQTGGDEPESGEKVTSTSTGALGIWVFAFFWNALAIPISAIAVPKMVQEGEWWGLLILIFPLIGLLMLWSAIRLTWLAIIRGSASLHIQNAPVHLGGVVAGHVTARLMGAGDAIRVKLECATATGTPQAVVHWTKETTARVVEGPQGARLAFSFQTPDRLPAGAGARDENTDWGLHLYRGDEQSPTYSFSFELRPPLGAEHEPSEDDEAEEAVDEDEPQLAAAAPSPVVMENLARMMGAKSVESMNPQQRARFQARLDSMTPQQREAIAKIGSYAGYLPLVKKLVIGIVVLFVLMQVIGAVTMLLFAK